MTSLADPVRESLSISEFFRVTGFFRSFRLWPGLESGDHCRTLHFSLFLLPDVAFLLVGILNGDDWDASDILSVNEFGVIIPGKDVGTLPTTSASFHLVQLKMTFLRMKQEPT